MQSENRVPGDLSGQPATGRWEARAAVISFTVRTYRQSPQCPTTASHDLLVLVSLYRGRSLVRYIVARHATLYNIARSGGKDVFPSRVVSMTSENIMTAVDSNQGTGKPSGRVGIVGTGHRGRVSLDVAMGIKSLRPPHESDRKLTG